MDPDLKLILLPDETIIVQFTLPCLLCELLIALLEVAHLDFRLFEFDGA